MTLIQTGEIENLPCVETHVFISGWTESEYGSCPAHTLIPLLGFLRC
jgi:hypothetical protein